jgi:hypothetical protein
MKLELRELLIVEEEIRQVNVKRVAQTEQRLYGHSHLAALPFAERTSVLSAKAAQYLVA